MTLWQDLRFAVRLLIRDRWFTVVAAVALAVGIGVNNTVFTLVNAVLIRGLPFDQPDRIISFGGTDARGRPIGVSRLDFEDWRDGMRSFSAMTLFVATTINVSDEGRAPEQFQGSYGSANLFRLIGQRPVMGRDFRPEDDRPGAEPVVILGSGILTMDQLLAQLRWSMRTFGSMFAIFAVIALLLSGVGLYAVTAYSVVQRTPEIGVRMALGAQPEQVLWLVLKRSLVQLAIGLPIGVAGAFGVGRLLQTLLVQTSSRDPATVASIAALMIAVSIAACYWPARRATRLDPVNALRYDG